MNLEKVERIKRDQRSDNPCDWIGQTSIDEFNGFTKAEKEDFINTTKSSNCKLLDNLTLEDFERALNSNTNNGDQNYFTDTTNISNEETQTIGSNGNDYDKSNNEEIITDITTNEEATTMADEDYENETKYEVENSERGHDEFNTGYYEETTQYDEDNENEETDNPNEEEDQEAFTDQLNAIINSTTQNPADVSYPSDFNQTSSNPLNNGYSEINNSTNLPVDCLTSNNCTTTLSPNLKNINSNPFYANIKFNPLISATIIIFCIACFLWNIFEIFVAIMTDAKSIWLKIFTIVSKFISLGILIAFVYIFCTVYSYNIIFKSLACLIGYNIALFVLINLNYKDYILSFKYRMKTVNKIVSCILRCGKASKFEEYNSLRLK